MFRTSIFGRIAVAATAVALALLAVGTPAARADGAPPLTTKLFTDINVGSAGSDPGPTVNVGGTAYTFGWSGAGDLALWKSDGTPAGTKFVASLGPNTWVSATAVLGGKLYFLAADELWVSDGTAAGTTSLYWTTGDDLLAFGSKMYFVKDSWLCTSDGTRAGTSEVAKVPPSRFLGGAPMHLVSAGGKLFFEEGSYGGLWVSDGTSAGTKQVTSAPYYVNAITAVGSRVSFTGSEDGTSQDLWISDGTKAGTHRVKDIDPTRADGVKNLVAVGSTLYFQARDASHGYELWKSNGTATGTVMVKDVRYGPRGSGPADLINVGGTLFFTANDGRHGLRLWKSNGTSAGTVAVSSTVPTHDNGIVQQMAVGSALFFSAQGVGGEELWKTNGTSAGTTQVKDINPTGDSSPRSLAAVGNRLFFGADDGVTGRELWVSDGTQIGTSLAADLNTATVSSGAHGLVRVGSTVFFAADDGVHGTELWKTDGTTAGTKLVKDINPGSASGLPSDWAGVPMGGRLYFVANDGINGYRLWKTDGTAAGTKLISSVTPEQLTVIGNKLVFVANDGDGQSLWKSDGTVAGTNLVKTFAVVGQGTGWIRELTSAGSQGYFVLDVEVETDWYPEDTYYLWRTNGTALGTAQITQLPDEGDPESVTAVGNELYFAFYGSGELWKSDGTAAGTGPVKSIDAHNGLQSLTAVGSKLFFTLDTTPDQVPQLWVSDGTTAGTQLVREFPSVYLYTPITDLTAVGANLFFVAGDRSPGDLWMSDGTPDGTMDICCTQAPSTLRAVGPLVFMSESWGPMGFEPSYAIDWGSGPPWCGPGDVCPSGWSVELVGDLNPGPAGSHPTEFIQLGTNVLFVADDGSHGAELWSAALP